MSHVQASSLLRLALLADALVSAAVAATHLLGGTALAEALALPPALLLGTGVFMVGYVVLLVLALRTRPLPAAAAWFFILGNLGWAVAALGLAASGLVQPNTWGLAFLGLHAAGVTVFSGMQWAGLRASSPVPATRMASRAAG